MPHSLAFMADFVQKAGYTTVVFYLYKIQYKIYSRNVWTIKYKTKEINTILLEHDNIK